MREKWVREGEVGVEKKKEKKKKMKIKSFWKNGEGEEEGYFSLFSFFF